MQYSHCISCLCAITFLCLSIAQANWFDYNVFAHQQYGRRLQERQLDPPFDEPTSTSTPIGTGVGIPTTISTSTSTIAPKTSSTTETSQEPTSTSAPTTNTTPNTAPKTTSKTSTSAPQATTTVVGPITKTTTFEPSTTVVSITSIVTVSGSVVTSVSASTEVTSVPSEPTDGASPGDNDKPNDAGLTPKNRNTIIGVVVGIGGTALLVGLGLVAHLIWGRKKEKDYNNGLMDYGLGGSNIDKTMGMSNARPVNPFQTTLENYHNPARVNASSNF